MSLSVRNHNQPSRTHPSSSPGQLQMNGFECNPVSNMILCLVSTDIDKHWGKLLWPNLVLNESKGAEQKNVMCWAEILHLEVNSKVNAHLCEVRLQPADFFGPQTSPTSLNFNVIQTSTHSTQHKNAECTHINMHAYTTKFILSSLIVAGLQVNDQNMSAISVRSLGSHQSQFCIGYGWVGGKNQ